MDRDDAEGAIAAATYFISLYSYVYATGDLTAWQEISDPECVFCVSVRDDQLAESKRGERSEGGSIVIVGTPSSTEGTEAGTYRIDASINQHASRTYDESGLIVGERPEQAGQMAIAVAAIQPGDWHVTAVGTMQGTP